MRGRANSVPEIISVSGLETWFCHMNTSVRLKGWKRDEFERNVACFLKVLKFYKFILFSDVKWWLRGKSKILEHLGLTKGIFLLNVFRMTFSFIFQGGIFKLVHTAKGETNAKHNVIYKVGFKAFTMIPMVEESLTKEKVLDYADYLHGLKGFETLAVYKLHECSGPIKEWHYDWIIEAFYNSVSVTEESVLKDLINCPMVDKKWELSIHKDYIQMTAWNINCFLFFLENVWRVHGTRNKQQLIWWTPFGRWFYLNKL